MQKHGFKPHEEVRSDQRGDSDPLGDVDTIPEHILNDEVLYRKYLEENVFQKDRSPELQEETRGSKSGSFSSLMNIFSAVKKSVMSKNVDNSRQNLAKVINLPFIEHRLIEFLVFRGLKNLFTLVENSNLEQSRLNQT